VTSVKAETADYAGARTPRCRTVGRIALRTWSGAAGLRSRGGLRGFCGRSGVSTSILCRNPAQPRLQGAFASSLLPPGRGIRVRRLDLDDFPCLAGWGSVMGNHRQAMLMIAQHPAPPAILSAIRCSNIVARGLPGTFLGGDAKGFPGGFHIVLRSVIVPTNNIADPDWSFGRRPYYSGARHTDHAATVEPRAIIRKPAIHPDELAAPPNQSSTFPTATGPRKPVVNPASA